jgi:hypothetical protein
VRRDPGFSIARPTRDIICGRVTSIAESTVTVEGDGAAPGGSFGLSVSPATALPFAVGSYLVVRSSTSHVAIHTDPSVLVFEGNGSLLAARLPGSFEVSGLTVERGARGRAEMGGWLRVYGLRVTLYGRLALLPPDTWRRLTTPRGTYLLQGSMTVVETPPPARPGTPSQQRPLDLYGGSLLNILREGVTR